MQCVRTCDPVSIKILECKKKKKKKNSRHFLVWKVTKYPSTLSPCTTARGISVGMAYIPQAPLFVEILCHSCWKTPPHTRSRLSAEKKFNTATSDSCYLLPLHWNVLTMKNMSIAHSTTHAALGLSYRSEYRPWIKGNKLMQATWQFLIPIHHCVLMKHLMRNYKLGQSN